MTEIEVTLLDTYGGTENIQSSLARYDKFIHGVDEHPTVEGWQQQVGERLVALAENQEQIFLETALNRDNLIREKGLSPEALDAETISVEDVEHFCNDTLEHYGLLSSVPASEYTSDRPGPASDNKWQVIVGPYTSLAVNPKQKIIKCPDKPQSAVKLISVSLAHEIEGHVIQTENKSNLCNLGLLNRVGSNRSSMYAEAGAVHNESYVTEVAFGYKKANHPHYIRAMITKLQGGDYSECLKTYYHSAIRAHQLQRDAGDISDTLFKQRCAKELEVAVNRTKRLFRGGASNTDTAKHLASSKDTVYVEQLLLAEELQKNNLTEVLYLTGINLETLAILIKAGMLKLDDIRKPDFYALQVWDRIKEKYTASVDTTDNSIKTKTDPK